MTNKAVAEALDGLPPMKMHCSLLAEEAVRSAIDDYLKKTTGAGLEGEQGKCTDPAVVGADTDIEEGKSEKGKGWRS